MPKNQSLMTAPRHRPRARTIDYPVELGELLKTCSRYEGTSAHALIQRAIRHEIESIYGRMALDAECV